MSNRGRIVRDRTLERWQAGLDEMDEPDAADELLWRQAMDVFFDRTQQLTHVISGALKESGRMDVRNAGKRIVGTIEYGGTPECDYAVYEFRRGGNHDALLNGYRQTQAVLQAALGDILKRKVNRWR